MDNEVLLWLEQDADGVRHDPLTGAYVVMIPDTTDVVRLPPQIGGTVHRVLKASIIECPRCGEPSQTLTLDNGIYVSLCRRHPNHCFCKDSSQ